MKKYLSILCMALFMMPVLVACSSDDDFENIYNEEGEVVGKLGKSEDCKLEIPKKSDMKNPFDEKYCSFYLNDKLDGREISSLCAMSTKTEGLMFAALFSHVDLSELKKGSKLDLLRVELGMSLSSDSRDYMYQKGQNITGSIYVRSIDGNSITVYLDHLKFNCEGGFHMTKGEYVLYGDLKLTVK